MQQKISQNKNVGVRNDNLVAIFLLLGGLVPVRRVYTSTITVLDHEAINVCL